MPFIKKSQPTSVPSMVAGGPDRAGHFFKSTIITNSGVMALGDVVSTVAQASGNGVVMRRYTTTGDPIVGICVGFGRANGRSVTFDAGSRTTVTVASDNETNAQIYALVEYTPGAVWSAPLSATIHTTAIFGAGAWIDPDTGTNSGRLAESGITRTTVLGRGCACLGPDPDDTTRGLVTLEETVFKAGIGA